MAESDLVDLESLRRAVPVLRTVAHVERLRIIDYLRSHERTVGEIAKAAGVGQALASQHLARLRDKGVVASRRDGNRRYYRLLNPCVLMMLECIQEHCRLLGSGGQPVEGDR